MKPTINIEEVTKDDREIVPALRAALTERIGKERFDLWFADVRLEVVGQTLHVAAADQFVLDRLRERLRHDLKAVGTEFLSKSARVEFHLDRSLSRKKRSSVRGADTDGAIVKYAERKASSPRRSKAPTARRPLATLEDYVAGEGSRIALTGAKTAVERPGSVSPVFIYGPTGKGKTHLLEGIAAAARRCSLLE